MSYQEVPPFISYPVSTSFATLSSPSSSSPHTELNADSPLLLNSCCNPRKLNILYFNARSLLPKISELQLIAETYSPSVICIVESWLCPDITDAEVWIPDYQLVRLDRNHNGGGVLMFISGSLQFSVLPRCEDLELLSVVVSMGSSKACISLFYRPPSSSSSILDSLCTYLASSVLHRFTNLILLGDFNVNFCAHSRHPLFSTLESLSHSLSLQQVVTEPTHVHHNGSTSLIDLVFVSNPLLINTCSVIPPLSNSDHNGLSLQCNWKSTHRDNCDNHSKGRVVTVRLTGNGLPC